MTEELSMRDFAKYRRFINTHLENEEGLAAISKRLQNAGVAPEMARALIREVALEHSLRAKNNAMISIFVGAPVAVILLTIGFYTGKFNQYHIIACVAFIGGIGLYFRSRKRLKYLHSLR